MKKARFRHSTISKISAPALREFAEIQRVANKAVQKAIEENRKHGITEAEATR
jgi:vacuolar-type H+-ATPase subunit E/Vma4